MICPDKATPINEQMFKPIVISDAA